jgi:hypothetical protein
MSGHEPEIIVGTDGIEVIGAGALTIRLNPNSPGFVWAAGSFTAAGVPALISALNVASVDHNGVGDYTVHLTNPIDVAKRAVTTDGAAPANSHYDIAGSTPSTIHILVDDATGFPADAVDISFICVRTSA